MLDGLLGRGFAPKCKSLIKLTKSRIEVIRRKRNATLKFLKKDMAYLLANGLDTNAYGRAEGLVAELTLSSCYDFVEQSCDFVLKHLSVLQKLRHCPEDCREVLSTIMFAAARFSDLPELRDLRHVFYERYGDSLEVFVNQKFVENLSSKPSTMEKKVRLMQDIATEFSIRWDPLAFEQRMSKQSAPAPAPAPVQPKIYGTLHVNDYKYKSTNGKDTVPKVDKHDVSSEEVLDCTNDRNRSFNDKERKVSKRNELNLHSKHEAPANGCKPFNVRENTTLKEDKCDILFQGRQEAIVEKHQTSKEDGPLKSVRIGGSSQRKRMDYIDGGYQLHDDRENDLPKRDVQDTITYGKPDIGYCDAGLWSKNDGKDLLSGNNYVGQYGTANSTRDIQEEVHKVKPQHHVYGGQHDIANSKVDVQEEIHKLKPFYHNAIPPPYTKPTAKTKDSKYEASFGMYHPGHDSHIDPNKPSRDKRANAGDGLDNIQRAYHPDNGMRGDGPRRVDVHGHGNYNHYRDSGISNPIPKPRSSRRKQSKSHSSHDSVGNSEDTEIVKRRSRSRRRDDSRKGLQVLLDNEHQQKDEEERVMDKLLMYYSKKPSAYEPGKVKRKSGSRAQGSGESPRHVSRVVPDEISEMTSHPPRSISLPHEQTSSEATKVFTRAASFQPDRLSPARHVHPKLPDYDDLAARFAALKGR